MLIDNREIHSGDVFMDRDKDLWIMVEDHPHDGVACIRAVVVEASNKELPERGEVYLSMVNTPPTSRDEMYLGHSMTRHQCQYLFNLAEMLGGVNKNGGVS